MLNASDGSWIFGFIRTQQTKREAQRGISMKRADSVEGFVTNTIQAFEGLFVQDTRTGRILLEGTMPITIGNKYWPCLIWKIYGSQN